MARLKNICGLYLINEKREILETLELFTTPTNDPKPQAALAGAREKAKLDGHNPYNTVLLPCGTRNEGLLPLS